MSYLDVKYLLLLSSYLRNFKQKSSKVFNFSCPICNDSAKKLTKSRGYAIVTPNNLHIYCHNCQYTAKFPAFLKHLNYNLYAEYLFEKFQNNPQENLEQQVKNLIIPVKFDKLIEYKELPGSIRCDHLPDDHYCIEYLKSRKIPLQHYRLLQYTDDYKSVINDLVPEYEKEILSEPRLIIPFYNEYNELIAVSGRSLESVSYKLRYVTVRLDETTDKLIYGMERLNKNNLITICEGPLDSLQLSNCIAAGNADLISVAKKLDVENVRLIWDNEPYNKDVVKQLDKALGLGYDIVIWPENWPYKDINEAILGGETEKSLERVLTQNTFHGLIGTLKLQSWKRT